MGDIKNPECPYCRSEMVSILYEHEDDTYSLFWSCSCEDVKEIENAYNRRIEE
jgi:hypothetical protein